MASETFHWQLVTSRSWWKIIERENHHAYSLSINEQLDKTKTYYLNTCKHVYEILIDFRPKKIPYDIYQQIMMISQMIEGRKSTLS